MTDSRIVPCPNCATLNRLPADKPAREGKCGNCKQPLFAGRPIVLGKANFDRHAGAADLPLLVDFWATWCGPCRAMAPIFEAAAGELEPRVRLGKVDTDAERDLAARYAIQAIPTMILFKGGREVARHSGTVSRAALNAWIEQALAA